MLPVSVTKTGLLIMIDQVLIMPHCVTKDIYYFGTTTVLGERSRGASTARKETAKKKKTTCHAMSSASQRSCWKLGVRVMRNHSVTAF